MLRSKEYIQVLRMVPDDLRNVIQSIILQKGFDKQHLGLQMEETNTHIRFIILTDLQILQILQILQTVVHFGMRWG